MKKKNKKEEKEKKEKGKKGGEGIKRKKEKTKKEKRENRKRKKKEKANKKNKNKRRGEMNKKKEKEKNKKKNPSFCKTRKPLTRVYSPHTNQLHSAASRYPTVDSSTFLSDIWVPSDTWSTQIPPHPPPLGASVSPQSRPPFASVPLLSLPSMPP